MPALEKLDAVLFDFDGVIVESTDIKTEAFRALFSNETQVAEIVVLHERLAGVSRMIKFEMIYRDILRRPLSEAKKQSLAARFQELVMERVIACPMVAGAQRVLDTLSGRVPMAVVSGTPEAELHDIVSRRGLAKYFSSLHGSPRVKPDIVQTLLKNNGWRPANVVIVGDAAEDYSAAAANDTQFIGRVARGKVSPFSKETAVFEDLRPVAAMFDAALTATAS